MNELDDFVSPTLERQIGAERALINGDPGPRLAMTSMQDPVTVFGAKVPVRQRWDEVSETIRWLAARWSEPTEYRFDLVAAAGRLRTRRQFGRRRPGRAVYAASHPHLPPRER